MLAEYQSVGADLNVMPYCSQFIPMEVLYHNHHHQNAIITNFCLVVITMILIQHCHHQKRDHHDNHDKVVNHPSLKSICYHPSLLPRHRGASAISWTLIEGDTKVIIAIVVMVTKAMIMMMIKIRMTIVKGGFSIFYPDDGLDTGDLLLTR